MEEKRLTKLHTMKQEGPEIKADSAVWQPAGLGIVSLKKESAQACCGLPAE
jgi:hypothetical protein